MMENFEHWQIGDVAVTRVVELEVVSGGTWLLPDATAQNLEPHAWLRPHFANDQGKQAPRLRPSVGPGERADLFAGRRRRDHR